MRICVFPMRLKITTSNRTRLRNTTIRGIPAVTLYLTLDKTILSFRYFFPFFSLFPGRMDIETTDMKSNNLSRNQSYCNINFNTWFCLDSFTSFQCCQLTWCKLILSERILFRSEVKRYFFSFLLHVTFPKRSFFTGTKLKKVGNGNYTSNNRTLNCNCLLFFNKIGTKHGSFAIGG